MADNFKMVDVPITQPIQGLPVIDINGKSIYLGSPVKIEKIIGSNGECNEVHVEYKNATQIITAEGSGNERHNFKSEYIAK